MKVKRIGGTSLTNMRTGNTSPTTSDRAPNESVFRPRRNPRGPSTLYRRVPTWAAAIESTRATSSRAVPLYIETDWNHSGPTRPASGNDWL